MKANLKELNHADFYQSALKALETGVDYKEACMEEQTVIMIAMTDSVLALYLLMRDDMNARYEANIKASKKKTAGKEVITCPDPAQPHKDIVIAEIEP